MGGSFKRVHPNHIRVGYAGQRDGGLAKRADCSGNSFYTAPTQGQSVDSAKPVTISWNTKCMNPAPQYVDLYLYAPSKNNSMIQAFGQADFTHGSLQTTLNANWWGLDTSVQLQLQIVKHGDNQFMPSTVVGPVWTATYNPSQGVPKPSSGNGSIAQRVKNIFHNLSGGQVAAAVILPLLAVAGIIAYFYIRRQRKKTEEKTHRFSKAVDQRMSTISTDWRSISGAGANAAIRKSMAVRDSMVGDGERPASLFNQAGIGSIRTSEEKVPQMEEFARPRKSVFEGGERISRVSFAPETRLSAYSEKENPRLPSAVRGLNVRSFHQGHTSFDEERPEDVDRDLNMSPTQTAGPPILHPGEIAARASTEHDVAFQREVLQMPAMTLMRTGGASDNELVLPPTLETPASSTAYGSALPAMPSPAHQPNTPVTPMTGLMPAMSSPNGPGLSPDALLRAYAAGRPLASSSTPSSGGMRVLYQNEPAATPVAPQYPQIQQFPASPTVSNRTTLAPADSNPFRKSMAGRSAYTESMYSAMAYDDQAAYDTNGDAYEHHSGHYDTYGYAG